MDAMSTSVPLVHVRRGGRLESVHCGSFVLLDGEQIIEAAGDNGGQIGVQADKYEGYSVWVNALIAGAGGDIASDTEGVAGQLTPCGCLPQYLTSAILA